VPLFSIVLSIFQSNSPSLFFNLTPTFYTTLWTSFGIAVALFTGILAFVDSTIRKELTITLFGATLLISAILDIYYLLILNEKMVGQSEVYDEGFYYFIWWVNRLFYSLTLLIGTFIYLKTKPKNLRDPIQKSKIIRNTFV